jgi:hypothetical protein
VFLQSQQRRCKRTFPDLVFAFIRLKQQGGKFCETRAEGCHAKCWGLFDCNPAIPIYMPSCSRRLIYSRTCFHCCHVRFLCRHSKHLVFRSSFIAFDRILTFTSVNRTTFLPAFALHQNFSLFALWLLIFSPYYFFSSVCF